MSTSVSTSFIKDFQKDVHHLFQRMGGMLRGTVRKKDNIIGESTTFQKSGKGTATTKARHGIITPMNADHTAILCTLVDFYAGDFVDKLDEAKLNIDERMVIARAGAWALGRKVDNQIITIFDTTSESAVSWTLSSEGTVRAALYGMLEALDANDVPNDGNRYVALTPRAWAQASTVEEFTSGDWVGADNLPLKPGTPGHMRFRNWNGALWLMHTDLPGVGTSTANVFAWHRDAVGYATAKSAGNIAANDFVSADIWWNGERAAHFVNHAMSGGACLIDTTGVIQGDLNDTTAIVTS